MKPYRLLETSQKYTEYDMIQKHTEIPDFPDVRAQLLYLFLSEAGSSRLNEKSERIFPLVTGLVQMALDTHDRIDTSPAHQQEEQMRSRQLNVLAGDYFSSRFYELLAKAGEIEMISRLSEAICENNRLKMSLYEQVQTDNLTVEQYMEASIQLKMQLFLSFTPYIQADKVQVWEELLYYFSRCEVLAADLQSKEQYDRPFGHYGWYAALRQLPAAQHEQLRSEALGSLRWQEVSNQYGIHAEMQQQLEQTLSGIEQQIKQLGPEAIQAGVSELAASYATLVHQA